jgi:cytochrome oxidase Cu insertion factor (SCO1/SenC/PrrC family)
MPAVTNYFLSTYSLILLSGIALAGCAKSYALEESEVAETANAWSEPAFSQPEHKDLVRILTRLPQFALTDQSGEELASHDLYGHVWVANFIFTRCKASCPVQTALMKEFQNDLKDSDNWKHTRIVSVSVDPEYDTPDVLTRYIKAQDLETSQWYFLTGSREAIWGLVKHGFHLPVADNPEVVEMPILHSSMVVLVDWEGRIRGYYNHFEEEDVRKLKRDLVRVTYERVIQPPDTANPDWIEGRMQRQLESARDFDVFHDFKFSDETANSGITFRHRLVDDAASVYKAVHYDHGNGIAVADVDLDGLYDIYFTSQAGSNELWRNLGNGEFENITDNAGLRIEDRIGVAASFGDIDNDGDPDLYITNVRTGNLLFENDGKGHFKDISRRSRTDIKAHSSGATFFDYDRDGLLDLYVSNVGVYTTDTISNVSVYTEQGQVITDQQYFVGFKDAFAGHLKAERTENSVLLRNKGKNRFEDVTRKVNLLDSSWSGDATVIDGNNDGWPDLYVINMQGNDEYYENVEGREFVRRSRELFPKTSWGSMGVTSFDFDNDGDMDIYVTDMHSDMVENVDVAKEKMKMEKHYPESFLQTGGQSIFGNAFYRNEGNGQFSEISDQIGTENYWPWGLSSGDLNSDGYEDVFITSGMNYPFRYAVNSLLLNNKGRGFLDSEYVLGVEPRKNGITATPWFEINCSGRDAGSNLCGKTRGRRVIWGALGSRSSVIFDLDQDGDQDIVTLEFNQSPLVLISNLSAKKKLNYLNVKLNGKSSNRSGVGARVKVFAGDDVYTKMHHGKSGYLSQSLYPLYFGLGSNKKIDQIEVTWPSGKVQVVDHTIEMNQVLEVTEPN